MQSGIIQTCNGRVCHSKPSKKCDTHVTNQGKPCGSGGTFQTEVSFKSPIPSVTISKNSLTSPYHGDLTYQRKETSPRKRLIKTATPSTAHALNTAWDKVLYLQAERVTLSSTARTPEAESARTIYAS